MGLSAGDVFLDVHPNLSSFNRELGARLGGLSGAASNILKPFGLSLGTAVGIGAGVAVGKFVSSSIDAFKEAEQIAAGTAAVIKSTGGAANVSADQVEGYADSLADMAGADDEAVQASLNLLLTFRQITDETGPENTFERTEVAVLDMATAMNNGAIPSMEKLSSTTIQVGKAVNDPIRGLTALQRVGVTFTEQQRKQIETMIESNDLMGAQDVILSELEAEFGGAAKAAGETFAGELGDLNREFGNLEEEVGSFFVPVLRRMVGVIRIILPLLRPLAENIGLVGASLLTFLAVRSAPAILVSIGAALQSVGAIAAGGAIGNVGLGLIGLGPASAIAATGIISVYTAVKLLSGADPTFAPKLGHALAEIVRQTDPLREGLEEVFGAEMLTARGAEHAARAAQVAGQRLRHFARMTNAEFHEWRDSIAESLDFAAQDFDDLAGRANVSARQILRTLRRANRDQEAFASDSKKFLGDVQENLGPRMQTAAQELVAHLAEGGREGADRLDALAGASTKMKKKILAEFLESDKGAKDFASEVQRAIDKVDALNVHLDQLPQTVTINIVGIPGAGGSGFGGAGGAGGSGGGEGGGGSFGDEMPESSTGMPSGTLRIDWGSRVATIEPEQEHAARVRGRP